MRFHLFGLAHVPVQWDRGICPFTTLTYNMARMIMASGHELTLYGVEGSDAPCTEFVEVVAADTVAKRYDINGPSIPWHHSTDHEEWLEMKYRGRAELKRRYRAGDISLMSYGYFHEFVQEFSQISAEFCCGYNGIFSRHRVFPSYSWMHYLYGEKHQCSNPNWFDCVIPHYLDPVQFPLCIDKEDYLLFVGRLDLSKGPDVAIDIAKHTGKKLVLVGVDHNCVVPQSLVDKASSMGDNVKFTGALKHDQLVGIMQHAKALLMPSRYIESFGMVGLEAMSCGTPVISTDWGAMTEVVIQGRTGFRCRDFEDFVYAVEGADHIDPMACREHVVRNYSLEATWPRYEKYFNKLVKYYSTPVNAWYQIGMPDEQLQMAAESVAHP